VVESGTKCHKVVNLMFMGEYAHQLDNKGRLIIPAKFREVLGDKMVINRGLDGCLNVYSLASWELILNQLKGLPTTKKESRMYMHMMTAKAALVEVDNAGRVLLPAPLIQEAGLSKACVIVGVVDHCEIWSEERWSAYYDHASESFETIAESLTDFLT
jgi:MraZ protein